MNCDECQDLLVEYSLGELGSADRGRVEAHLGTGCAECRREVVELQEALSVMGESLSEVPPPPAIRGQLLARIAAEKRGRDDEHLVRPAGVSQVARSAREAPWQRFFAYAATLLCGFLIGALAVRQYSGSSVAAVDREAQLAEMLESARQDFGAPKIRFASLRTASDSDAVVGHMMWDSQGRNLHVFAFDIEPAAADRQLAVWFVPAEGAPRYVGSLDVSAEGSCSAVFQAPQLSEPIVRMVVTDEPEGEVTKPSGPERMVSRFE